MHPSIRGIYTKICLIFVIITVSIIGIVSATSIIDDSTQNRINQLIETFKRNTSDMSLSDKLSYYKLVNMNIDTLIVVLNNTKSLVIGEISKLETETSPSVNLTSGIAPVITSVSSGDRSLNINFTHTSKNQSITIYSVICDTPENVVDLNMPGKKVASLGATMTKQSTDNNTSHQITVGGLVNGTTYQCKAFVVNDNMTNNGPGPYSNISNGVMPKSTGSNLQTITLSENTSNLGATIFQYGNNYKIPSGSKAEFKINGITKNIRESYPTYLAITFAEYSSLGIKNNGANTISARVCSEVGCGEWSSEVIFYARSNTGIDTSCTISGQEKINNICTCPSPKVLNTTSTACIAPSISSNLTVKLNFGSLTSLESNNYIEWSTSGFDTKGGDFCKIYGDLWNNGEVISPITYNRSTFANYGDFSKKPTGKYSTYIECTQASTNKKIKSETLSIDTNPITVPANYNYCKDDLNINPYNEIKTSGFYIMSSNAVEKQVKTGCTVSPCTGFEGIPTDKKTICNNCQLGENGCDDKGKPKAISINPVVLDNYFGSVKCWNLEQMKVASSNSGNNTVMVASMERAKRIGTKDFWYCVDMKDTNGHLYIPSEKRTCLLSGDDNCYLGKSN